MSSKMNSICQNIIELFSSSYKLESKKEDCDTFYVEYSVSALDRTLPDDCNLTELNSRDQIAIKLYESNASDSVDYIPSKKNNWKDFVDEITSQCIQTCKIKIEINKNVKNYFLSIYDIDIFTNYIENLSLPQFLMVINNRFKEKLIFEIQDINYLEWSTSTIAFIPKNSKFTNSGIGNINRENRIADSRNFCCCEMTKYNLIPQDLYCSQIDQTNLLQVVFQKACVIYTCSFIFDYSRISASSYEYRLNGFKTLVNSINISKIFDIQIDIDSLNTIFRIYEWLYLGGNNIDKINIARNIVSLNIERDNLSICSSTMDSILSNYKIYEKENVKQYLSVRNKLSEILIDLQEKIGRIMDSFIGDFKKNIITLVSFFISVIVIRVVSKGDFIDGFTNEIIGLSFIFLIISIGLLLYSRWELINKIKLYSKHYNQLKERYKDILSDNELKKIFEDCDPQRDGSNSFFVEQQRKYYSWVWAVSIFLLFVFLIVVYFVNNNITIPQIIDIAIDVIQVHSIFL